MVYKFLILWIALFPYLFAEEGEKIVDDLYGSISSEKYLIGDFNPPSFFIKYDDKISGRTFYMRKDTFEQFKKMKEAYKEFAKKDKNNKVKEISLRSAFRSFSDQKHIWESKYTGKTPMSVSIQGKTDDQIADIILRYSSAPGTSRHHWGTDLDLNSLDNSYFKKGGAGEKLYEWLLENAEKYGFCQPYNEHSERGNKGYYEERWHWSYKPISSQLKNDWNEYFKNNKLNFKKHLGDTYMGSKYDDQSKTTRREVYVNSINTSCTK